MLKMGGFGAPPPETTALLLLTGRRLAEPAPTTAL